MSSCLAADGMMTFRDNFAVVGAHASSHVTCIRTPAQGAYSSTPATGAMASPSRGDPASEPLARAKSMFQGFITPICGKKICRQSTQPLPHK
jgi:hypothetical protein